MLCCVPTCSSSKLPLKLPSEPSQLLAATLLGLLLPYCRGMWSFNCVWESWLMYQKLSRRRQSPPQAGAAAATQAEVSDQCHGLEGCMGPRASPGLVCTRCAPRLRQPALTTKLRCTP
jgi:hypothetical protein